MPAFCGSEGCSLYSMQQAKCLRTVMSKWRARKPYTCTESMIASAIRWNIGVVLLRSCGIVHRMSCQNSGNSNACFSQLGDSRATLVAGNPPGYGLPSIQTRGPLQRRKRAAITNGCLCHAARSSTRIQGHILRMITVNNIADAMLQGRCHRLPQIP